MGWSILQRTLSMFILSMEYNDAKQSFDSSWQRVL